MTITQKNSRNAVTHYFVEERFGKYTYVRCILETGRTHQIRVHFSHIGHPLVGDGKYGINRADRADGYKYQALYSYRLIFNFKNDGALGYLSGKQIALKPESVWFLKDYAGSEEKVAKIING